MHHPVFDVEFGGLIRCLGEALESRTQRRLGRCIQRRVVQIHFRQGLAAIVGAVVDVDDLELVLEQLDGRQDALTVQAIRVEPIRMEVRCRDDAHPVIEQRFQQAMQDHRVGDVRHMKLIETDEAETPGHALTQHLQRVHRAVHAGEFAVNLAHELMEVKAGLSFERHGVEEAVHQEALAPSHATVHVDTARDRRVPQEPCQRIAASRLVVRPFGCTPLQRLDGTQLRGVGLVAAFAQGVVIDLTDRHDSQRVRPRFKGPCALRSSASACRPQAPPPWSTR